MITKIVIMMTIIICFIIMIIILGWMPDGEAAEMARTPRPAATSVRRSSPRRAGACKVYYHYYYYCYCCYCCCYYCY